MADNDQMAENEQLSEIRAGKVDSALITKAGLAMAYAGHDWAQRKNDINKLPPDKQREELEKLAHHALRETPVSKKGASEYDPAHPTILDAQLNTYIQRSYEKDIKEGKVDKDGKPTGENLKAFLDEVDAKTKARGITDDDFKQLNAINFTQVYKGQDEKSKKDRKFLQEKFPVVQALQGDFNEAAAAHIDKNLKGVSFKDDLIAQVQKDDKKVETNGERKTFKNAAEEENQPMGGGILMLIMMFIGALLGIDIGSLFGGGQKAAETTEKIERKGQENGISFLNEVKPAIQNLKQGKASEDEVQTIENFAGISADKRIVGTLTKAQQEALGKAIQDHIDIDVKRGDKEAAISADLGSMDWNAIAKKAAEGTLPSAAPAPNAPGGTVDGGNKPGAAPAAPVTPGHGAGR